MLAEHAKDTRKDLRTTKDPRTGEIRLVPKASLWLSFNANIFQLMQFMLSRYEADVACTFVVHALRALRCAVHWVDGCTKYTAVDIIEPHVRHFERALQCVARLRGDHEQARKLAEEWRTPQAGIIKLHALLRHGALIALRKQASDACDGFEVDIDNIHIVALQHTFERYEDKTVGDDCSCKTVRRGRKPDEALFKEAAAIARPNCPPPDRPLRIANTTPSQCKLATASSPLQEPSWWEGPLGGVSQSTLDTLKEASTLQPLLTYLHEIADDARRNHKGFTALQNKRTCEIRYVPPAETWVNFCNMLLCVATHVWTQPGMKPSDAATFVVHVVQRLRCTHRWMDVAACKTLTAVDIIEPQMADFERALQSVARTRGDKDYARKLVEDMRRPCAKVLKLSMILRHIVLELLQRQVFEACDGFVVDTDNLHHVAVQLHLEHYRARPVADDCDCKPMTTNRAVSKPGDDLYKEWQGWHCTASPLLQQVWLQRYLTADAMKLNMRMNVAQYNCTFTQAVVRPGQAGATAIKTGATAGQTVAPPGQAVAPPGQAVAPPGQAVAPKETVAPKKTGATMSLQSPK
ncbi:hypothetical protein COO60DRAFT_1643789 [Scenedesmus sp. NREL 46B-D3]|nr:hypothetical protein COO60DRAFT_1643789 [Scenedesmus sp. NREL 46B-D3]